MSGASSVSLFSSGLLSAARRDKGSKPDSIPVRCGTRPRVLLKLILLATLQCALLMIVSVATVQLVRLSVAGMRGYVVPVASSISSSSGYVCFCSHPSVTFSSLSEVSSTVPGLTVFFPKMSNELGRLSTTALSLTPERYSGLCAADESFFTDVLVLATKNMDKK